MERRQFGRRESHISAYVVASNGATVPCVVRNVSERGALIEPLSPIQAGPVVRLVVSSLGVDLRCEVRHQTAQGIGVRFFNYVAAATLMQGLSVPLSPPSAAEAPPGRSTSPAVTAPPLSTRELRSTFVKGEQPETSPPDRTSWDIPIPSSGVVPRRAARIRCTPQQG